MEAHLSAARIHRLFGGLYAILAVVTLVVVVGLAISNGDGSILGGLTIAVFFGIPAAIHLLTARAAAKGDGSGKAASTVIAVLMLFGFPIGTVVGAYLLYLASQNWHVQKRPRMSSADLASAFPGAAPAPMPTIAGGDRPA
jgi:hypothetical protein